MLINQLIPKNGLSDKELESILKDVEGGKKDHLTNNNSLLFELMVSWDGSSETLKHCSTENEYTEWFKLAQWLDLHTDSGIKHLRFFIQLLLAIRLISLSGLKKPRIARWTFTDNHVMVVFGTGKKPSNKKPKTRKVSYLRVVK